MINAKKVLLELETGLSAVCAWCEHYHNAKDRSVVRNGKVSCGMTECGGPSSGKGFPLYKGIMEHQLSTFCFICGKDAEASFEIGGRMLGVCNRMGPNKQTCMDKLREILAQRNVIVNEVVVPVVGEKTEISKVPE